MFSPKLKPRSPERRQHKSSTQNVEIQRPDDVAFEVPEGTPVLQDDVVDKICDVYSAPSFITNLQESHFKAPEEAPGDDFVILNKNDAVEAMAYFIASYVQNLPEAQTLTPQQLQQALQATFKALRTHRLQRVWSVTRKAYRYAAISYSVFRLYEHPWVMRAVLGALWAGSKTAYALLM